MPRGLSTPTGGCAAAVDATLRFLDSISIFKTYVCLYMGNRGGDTRPPPFKLLLVAALSPGFWGCHFILGYFLYCPPCIVTKSESNSVQSPMGAHPRTLAHTCASLEASQHEKIHTRTMQVGNYVYTDKGYGANTRADRRFRSENQLPVGQKRRRGKHTCTGQPTQERTHIKPRNTRTME